MLLDLYKPDSFPLVWHINCFREYTQDTNIIHLKTQVGIIYQMNFDIKTSFIVFVKKTCYIFTCLSSTWR